ncbi:MAG: glycosyltransferase family 4 protein [Deltaproteobacteria bacterium]|nr:glycosyltransferase family 4 protein [Deltaproteobacteria bacterium]
MRLLIVSTSYPNRAGHGSGTFVHEQARSMAARGHEVRVICPNAPELVREESIDAVQVTRFRYAPGGLERVAYGGGIPANLRAKPWLWLAVPSFVGAMATAIRHAAASADLVHTHWTAAGLAAVISGVRVPIVASFHGSDLMTSNALMKDAARAVTRRSRAVLVHSREMAEHAAVVAAPSNVFVLPLGVDTAAIAALEDRERCDEIVCVGRLSREKGQDVLLDAFTRLPYSGTRLRLVGTGPTERELRDQANRLGISARVDFAGECPHADTVESVRRARIAAIPSRREGFSLACLEAMAAGSAIVATRCGGPEELLDDGRCGLLAPPDDPAALADALGRLLGDGALRARLGLAARDRAALVYDRERVADELERFYRRAIETPPAPIG